MEQAVCREVATVRFWDAYAPWYKLWMEHTRYHDRVVEVLGNVIERGWKVLDIGAGNGVLSIPLSIFGCEVTALEPSAGMRNLLYERMFQATIEGLSVDDRRWEDVPCFEYMGYDLIMACNSLHLTGMGFEDALAKIFRAGPKNVLLISELIPDNRPAWRYGDYTTAFTESYETDSSYAYHTVHEVIDHWAFKKGRALQACEVRNLKDKIVVSNGHLRIEDSSRVTMYWWRRNGDTALFLRNCPLSVSRRQSKLH